MLTPENAAKHTACSKTVDLGPRTMNTHGFDFDCGTDEQKGGYCTSGQIL